MKTMRTMNLVKLLLCIIAIMLIINQCTVCNCFDNIDEFTELNHRDELKRHNVEQYNFDEKERFMNWLEAKRSIDDDEHNGKEKNKGNRNRIKYSRESVDRENVDLYRNEWEGFKKKYNKHYNSYEEEIEAYLNFLESLRSIDRINNGNNDNDNVRELQEEKKRTYDGEYDRNFDELYRIYKDDWEEYKRKNNIKFEPDLDEQIDFLKWIKENNIDNKDLSFDELWRRNRDKWEARKRADGKVYRAGKDERDAFLKWADLNGKRLPVDNESECAKNFDELFRIYRNEWEDYKRVKELRYEPDVDEQIDFLKWIKENNIDNKDLSFEELWRRNRDKWEVRKRESGKRYKAAKDERADFINWCRLNKKIVPDVDDKYAKNIEELFKIYGNDWDKHKRDNNITYKPSKDEIYDFLKWFQKNNNNNEEINKNDPEFDKLWEKNKDAWEEYKRKNGKKYETSEEEKKDFLIYCRVTEKKIPDVNEINDDCAKNFDELFKLFKNDWQEEKRRNNLKYEPDDEEKIDFIKWLEDNKMDDQSLSVDELWQKNKDKWEMYKRANGKVYKTDKDEKRDFLKWCRLTGKKIPDYKDDDYAKEIENLLRIHGDDWEKYKRENNKTYEPTQEEKDDLLKWYIREKNGNKELNKNDPEYEKLWEKNKDAWAEYKRKTGKRYKNSEEERRDFLIWCRVNKKDIPNKIDDETYDKYCDALNTIYGGDWEKFKRDNNITYVPDEEEKIDFAKWFRENKMGEINRDNIEQLMRDNKEEWDAHKRKCGKHYKADEDERKDFVKWSKDNKKLPIDPSFIDGIMEKWKTEWEAFKTKYGIIYATREEERLRFMIWLQTREMGLNDSYIFLAVLHRTK